MTPQQITNKVNEEASARLSEVVGRVFSTMRNRHTHQSWMGECGCAYCRFIRGDYVEAKLRLHRIKKRINYYENIWNLTETEMHNMMGVEMIHRDQLQYVWALKQHKQELKEEVL